MENHTKTNKQPRQVTTRIYKYINEIYSYISFLIQEMKRCVASNVLFGVNGLRVKTEEAANELLSSSLGRDKTFQNLIIIFQLCTRNLKCAP